MRHSGSAGSAEDRGRELARRMYAGEDEGGYAAEIVSFPDEEDDMSDVYGIVARNNNVEDAEDDVLNEENDNVDADSMPPEYYDQIDRFLSIPPPKVVSSKKGSSLDNLASQKPPKNVFSKGGATRALPAAPAIMNMKKVSAKVDSGTKSAVGARKKASIEIDHTLLQEAFAYTDKLVRDNMMDELTPQQAPAMSRTRDVRSSDNGTRGVGAMSAAPEARVPRASDSSSIVYNVIKQSANIYSSSDLKTKKKKESLVNKIRKHVDDNPTFTGADAPESGRGFGVAAVPEEDLRKNAIDFDELVNNFTAGTTIQRLRSELSESQSAMNRSRGFIDQLAKELNIKK